MRGLFINIKVNAISNDLTLCKIYKLKKKKKFK